MALKEIPGDIEGTIGSIETIQIVPRKKGYVVSIVQVLYGKDGGGPKTIAPNPDGKSFNITIQAGNNRLHVILLSPNPIDGVAVAQQTINGTKVILEGAIEFASGIAVWNPDILGS